MPAFGQRTTHTHIHTKIPQNRSSRGRQLFRTLAMSVCYWWAPCARIFIALYTYRPQRESGRQRRYSAYAAMLSLGAESSDLSIQITFCQSHPLMIHTHTHSRARAGVECAAQCGLAQHRAPARVALQVHRADRSNPNNLNSDLNK